MDMDFKRLPYDLVLETLGFLDASTLLLCVASLAKDWQRHTAETIKRFRSLCVSDLQKLIRLVFVLSGNDKDLFASDATLSPVMTPTVLCSTFVVDVSFDQLCELSESANLTYQHFPNIDRVVLHFSSNELFKTKKRIRTSASTSATMSSDRFMECLALRFGGNSRRLVVRGKLTNQTELPRSFVGLDSFDFSGCEMPLDNDKVFSVDSSSTSVCGEKFVAFLEQHLQCRMAAAKALRDLQICSVNDIASALGTRPSSCLQTPLSPMVYRIVESPILQFVSIPLSVFFDADAYHQRINSRLAQVSSFLSSAVPNMIPFFEDAQAFRRRQYVDFNMDAFERFCSLSIQRVSLNVDACVVPSFFATSAMQSLSSRLQSLTFSKSFDASVLYDDDTISNFSTLSLSSLETLAVDLDIDQSRRATLLPWLVALLSSVEHPLRVGLSHLTCRLQDVGSPMLSRCLLRVNRLRLVVDCVDTIRPCSNLVCNSVSIDAARSVGVVSRDTLLHMMQFVATLWSPGIAVDDLCSWRRRIVGNVRCSLTQVVENDDARSIVDMQSLLDMFQRIAWSSPVKCNVAAKPDGSRYVQVATCQEDSKNDAMSSMSRSLYSFSPSAFLGTQRTLRVRPEKRQIPKDFVLLTPF